MIHMFAICDNSYYMRFLSAGIACTEPEVAHWAEEKHCVAPYPFKQTNLVLRPDGTLALSETHERERLVHFPVD